MTQSAKDFGSDGSLQLPSLSSSRLGAAMSSIATSLTASQRDDDGQHRKVRIVTRENRHQLSLLTETVEQDEFDVYMIDSVTHMTCVLSEKGTTFVNIPLTNVEAKGVAIKKNPFGEGTERFAFQFLRWPRMGLLSSENPWLPRKASSKRAKTRSHGRIMTSSQSDFVAFNTKHPSVLRPSTANWIQSQCWILTRPGSPFCHAPSTICAQRKEVELPSLLNPGSLENSKSGTATMGGKGEAEVVRRKNSV